MNHTVSEEELVLVINELHHNFENDYHKINHAMHLSERGRWLQLLTSINTQGKDILDIGTGSGFVPSIFLEAGVRFKLFTCSDISEKLLADARRRLGKNSKQFRFIKLQNQNLPFPDASKDIIIVNSVLHHLPSRKKFYSETARVLRSGGLLIVAHEPNKRFVQSKFLHGISKFAASSFSFLGKIRKSLTRKSSVQTNFSKINTELIRRGLISKPLSIAVLSAYVDYHADAGIDWTEAPRVFTVKRVRTYNYLSSLSFAYSYWWWRLGARVYDAIMSALFRHKGGTFTVVYERC